MKINMHIIVGIHVLKKNNKRQDSSQNRICRFMVVFFFSKSRNQYLNMQMALSLHNDSDPRLINKTRLDCIHEQPNIPKCEVRAHTYNLPCK